jgi:hypothetical protein
MTVSSWFSLSLATYSSYSRMDYARAHAGQRPTLTYTMLPSPMIFVLFLASATCSSYSRIDCAHARVSAAQQRPSRALSFKRACAAPVRPSGALSLPLRKCTAT